MLASGLECVEIMEQIDADLKMAERYLLHYEKELAEYEAAKAAFMAGQQGQCGGRGNLPGKPVEVQAIRGVEFDNSYVGYPWLKAVEIVQRSLGERKNIFIQVRREAEKKKLTTEKGGRPAWVGYLQTVYAERLAERFAMPPSVLPERTIRAWWGRLVARVMEVALHIKKNL